MEQHGKTQKNYEREGTSLNINKGRSGRRGTVTTEKTVEAVRLYVENNAKNASCRRIGLGLSRSNFNKTMKQNLKRDPHQIVTWHKLRDYVRRFQFCQWLLNQCNRQF